MKQDRRLLLTTAAAALLGLAVVGLFAGAAFGFVLSALSEADRSALAQMLLPHLPLILMAALMAVGLAAWAAQRCPVVRLILWPMSRLIRFCSVPTNIISIPMTARFWIVRPRGCGGTPPCA